MQLEILNINVSLLEYTPTLPNVLKLHLITTNLNLPYPLSVWNYLSLERIFLLRNCTGKISRLLNQPMKFVNHWDTTECNTSTRTEAGNKLRCYRWRMMESAVLVWNQQRQSVNFHVHDFKQERLTPSFAIYNDATYFRLPSVLTKTSLA